jgi:hypothetical protein
MWQWWRQGGLVLFPKGRPRGANQTDDQQGPPGLIGHLCGRPSPKNQHQNCSCPGWPRSGFCEHVKGAALADPLATVVNETLKIMAWTKFKTAALVAAGVLLAAATATVTLVEARSGGSPAASAASGLSFESFLEKPPRIANALWEMDVPASPGGSFGNVTLTGPAGSNAGSFQLIVEASPAHTEAQRLVYDGDNYLLAQLMDVHSSSGGGGSAGQYNGMQWGVQYAPNDARSWLVSWDTNSNPTDVLTQPTTGRRPPVHLEIQGRYAARRFLCLGMYEMVPGSVIWTKDRTQFTATYDEPDASNPVIERDINGSVLRTNMVPFHGQMTVKLKYENDVPVEADINLDGKMQHFVTYKYSRDFEAGRLPVEFSRYSDRAHKESGRGYTIRVKSLELASGPIPISELDPHAALGRRFFLPKVFTNGVAYREGPNGELQPLPTLEELSAGQTGRKGANQ